MQAVSTPERGLVRAEGLERIAHGTDAEQVL